MMSATTTTASGQARPLIGRNLPLLLKLVQLLSVVLIATLVVFFLMHMTTGDPAITLAGEYATKERIEEIRKLYGFDRPLIVQYVSWLSNVLHGDLSRSLTSGEPVLDAILRRLPNTLLIVFYTMGLSLLIGIPMALISVIRPHSKLDNLINDVSSVGIAVPGFWIAMILIPIFAVNRHWFPATGSVPIGQDFVQAIWYATMPAIVLCVSGTAEVIRQLRSAMIEVLSSQHFRTLRAKGLSETNILLKHGIKNVSVNLLTVIGILLNRQLGHVVIVEAVFAIPGIGTMISSAAINQDFPVIQGVVLVMALIVISVNFIVDILCRMVDPRFTREDGK